MTDEIRDLQIVTGENRRLQKEIAELRERVDALERSRWWRLHPRFLLRDLRRELRPRRGAATEARVPTPAAADVNPLIERFHDEVVSRGSFSSNWFSNNIPIWEPLLRDLDEVPSSILEIGSFEGLSACYLLWRLPEAHITCIDTFEGSPENIAYGESVSDLEARFDANVALVDAARVRKIRGDSRGVLPTLRDEQGLFDLVYVDGSHLALDVLTDASLSWPLVAPHGVVVFDDYVWAKLGDDPLTRPGPAVDAFIVLLADHAEIVFRGGQVALRKLD